MGRFHRKDEEETSVPAELHYRDGTTLPMRIPSPRPDAILFESFTAGNATWQPGEVPSEAKPVAILFRRDTHKDRSAIDHDDFMQRDNRLVGTAHYEQDSRWPPAPSDATNAECDDCYRK